MSMSREGTLSRHRQRSEEDCGTMSGCASGGEDSGGGGLTPPPRIRPGKMMAVKVQMLDDSITLFQVQVKAPGKILFDQVCKQLNLLEVDYFGLEYKDQFGVTYWVDVDKQMDHQIALTSSEPLFMFCVKFYTPDPAQIEEEYTRYLFSLQIKRDLAMGLLQCNDNTAALMASYIVQAECGDYVVEDYPDHTYLSSFKFVPQQDANLERRIMENHKKHVGQSPAEADLNLLETARRCELYGTKMHAAKDHDGKPLHLDVAHMGVVVFQNLTKINTFSWAKIRKLSFKRKKYLIKLHPEGYGYYRDTVEFYFEDRNQCKNFWKKCVEHHGFFRCTSSAIRAKDREKRRLIPRGSSFRYSGKTQKEMQEFVRENFVKRQSFHRHVRHLHSSLGNVSQSISAQPLLPLGDGIGASDEEFRVNNNTGNRLLPPQRGRGGSLVPPPVLVPPVSELRIDPTSFDFKEEENDDEDEDLLRRGIVGSGIVHPDYGGSSAQHPVYNVIGSIYGDSRKEEEEGEAIRKNSLGEQRIYRQTDEEDEEEDDLDEEDEASDDEEEDRGASSEDNLSHESYDLIDKEEEGNRRHRLPTNVASLPNTLLRKDKNQFEREFYHQVHRNTTTLPHHYRIDKKHMQRLSPEGIVIYDDFVDGEEYARESHQRENSDNFQHRVQYYSLPRNNYDTYFVQQPINPALNKYFVNENTLDIRTLPSIRNKESGVSSSVKSSTLKPPSTTIIVNNVKDSGTRVKECSSGSSSSHASPRVARPQSLDFSSSKTEPAFLRNNMDEDSSSAVSGMCPSSNLPPSRHRHQNLLEYNYASSSDVPQTPEGTNSFRRAYLDAAEDEEEEERIYDVPEGIEGVDDPIITHRQRRPSSSNRVVSFAPINKYHKIQPPIPPPRNDVHGAPYPKLRTQLNVVKPGHRQESSEKPPPIIATPTNRNLLPMSSTESESLSARSAPTPLTVSKNRLLPSPPEESESSLTVLDSESVPAPPEFASTDSKDPPQKSGGPEDTDVDDEEGGIFSMKGGIAEEPSPIIHQENVILEEIIEEDEIYEVAIDGDIELEIVNASSETIQKEVIRVEATRDEDYPSQTLSAPPAIGDEKRVKSSDSSSSTRDGTTSDSVIRMAEMYVRLGNGSTDNDDSSVLPYIEDEIANFEKVDETEEKLHEDLSDKEREDGKSATAVFPMKQHPETVYIDTDLPSPPTTIVIASSHPPPPQSSFDDDEVTTEAMTTVVERSPPTTSEIDLSVIPPPPEDQIPYMMEVAPPFSPYQPRALSRISERSSFERDEDDDTTPQKDNDMDDANTLTDQNYSTSDDANKSLSSDLPLPQIEDEEPRLEEIDRPRSPSLGEDSGGFPSPPSSLEIPVPAHKAESIQAEGDSLFLEITPPDLDKSLSEDDKIPYDLSASSVENDGFKDEEYPRDSSKKDDDDDDSLHNSMEILEDVATEDHFEELRHEDDEEEESPIPTEKIPPLSNEEIIL